MMECLFVVIGFALGTLAGFLGCIAWLVASKDEDDKLP